MNTDFGFEIHGCHIAVEKGDTINSLLGFMNEDKSAYFYHKIILLG